MEISEGEIDEIYVGAGRSTFSFPREEEMLTMSEQKQLLNEPVGVISSYQEEEKDSACVSLST